MGARSPHHLGSSGAPRIQLHVKSRREHPAQLTVEFGFRADNSIARVVAHR